MSAARLFCSIAAFSVCFVSGRVKAARVREELDSEKRLLCDIKTAERIVSASGGDIYGAAEKLSASGECNELWRRVAEGIKAGSSFYGAYSSANKPRLSGEASRIMDELAKELGSGARSNEAERLKSARERLAALCSAHEAQTAEKTGLINTLSTLLGLAAALLLL